MPYLQSVKKIDPRFFELFARYIVKLEHEGFMRQHSMQTEIKHVFLFFPKTLKKTNYKYATNKDETKWLTWEYIEGQHIQEMIGERYEKYWSSQEEYVKWYRIDLGRSIRLDEEFRQEYDPYGL